MKRSAMMRFTTVGLLALVLSACGTEATPTATTVVQPTVASAPTNTTAQATNTTSSGSSGSAVARPTPVSQKPDKPYRIAMIAFQNNPFWFPVRDGVNKANDALKPLGASVTWIVAGDTLDVPTVNAAIRAAVVDGYDAIGVVPLAEGACPAMKDAVGAGRVVATFIAEGSCSQSVGSLFFHGQDSTAAGKALANLLIKADGDKGGKVGVITGFFNVESHEQRRKGFIDGLKGSKFTLVNDGVENNDQADKAASIARDMIASNPDLAAIYITAGGPFGAAEEVGKEGKSGQIKVLGYDFTDEAVKAIRAGNMYATIGQDPYGEGYDTAIWLYNYLVTKQKPSDQYFVPVRADIMTKDNVDQILATQK